MPCPDAATCRARDLRLAADRMQALAERCRRQGWSTTAAAAVDLVELIDAPGCPLGRLRCRDAPGGGQP
ncbi:MAG: hypothetical protein RLZZ127_3240 [Planctomycetota bacterium]